MDLNKVFDVLVIGGGHAGVEAALASARMGADTLLLTHNIDTIGQMSCNPAIGGIGKSHLVSELDAMGGIMARAADQSGIQFRILNARKGPAVRATRVQTDRMLYKQAVRFFVERAKGLSILQQSVEDLLVDQGTVVGVVTGLGLSIRASSIVLTTGTFLGGKIHVGQDQSTGGRAGDIAAIGLAERLRGLNLPVSRLKTGTPPRISAKSVDFSVMTEQPGDTPLPSLSCWDMGIEAPTQVPCHITYTTPDTHQIIQDNLAASAMYSGAIEGVGPRYCPSIEDKVVRFADKSQHQIFVEPEGLVSEELYPNGLSTSLPFKIQCEFIRSIPGFEQAMITRPGYAIEYDYFDPQALSYSLETTALENLFFAGQINGTTGYEEAAAQGLLAGINAVLKVRGRSAWWPRRDQAYLGVLVDDLIRQGTQEPYRMFTSRAEYRLLLREDNADVRLTEQARALGLIDDELWAQFEYRQEQKQVKRHLLSSSWVRPGTEQAQAIDQAAGCKINKECSLAMLLKRPEVSIWDVLPQIDPQYSLVDQHQAYSDSQKLQSLINRQLEIEVKYQGYIDRQASDVEKLQKLEATQIPSDFNFADVVGLSNEVCQKLCDQSPATLGQASRISGVTPASIALLSVYLKKYRGTAQDKALVDRHAG